MAIIAYVLPIIPGQEETVEGFGRQLDEEGLRQRYEELNANAGITSHQEWIQPTPAGSLRVVVFETTRPESVARRFSDDAYDRWWRAHIRACHGFDPADVADPGLRPVWSWSPSP
jgi:hypothetical protein